MPRVRRPQVSPPQVQKRVGGVADTPPFVIHRAKREVYGTYDFGQGRYTGFRLRNPS
jgi:hypothetical protein